MRTAAPQLLIMIAVWIMTSHVVRAEISWESDLRTAHQKAEAARVAQPGSPPHPTSARFPVLGQREPPTPNHLTVAHSCKVGASSLAPEPTTSSKLAPAAPR